MLVRGIVVDDGMDDFSVWDGALDGIEEFDGPKGSAGKFRVGVLRHEAADDGAVEDIERG